jgi:hypothetical protein
MINPNITRTSFGGQTRTSVLQQAVLEANRKAPGSFKTIGNNFIPNSNKIESDLTNLKVRIGMEQATRDPGGISGKAFKALYPDKYAALQENILDKNKQFLRGQIVGASLTGNKAALSAAQKSFTEAMKTGGSPFSMSMPTRLALNANWSATKMGAKVGMGALREANMVSHAVLGTGLKQVGIAAALVGGIGYGIGSALGISGSQVAETASAVHQEFKQASKPVYGYSEIGQSTQGLVFGLHSRRTR